MNLEQTIGFIERLNSHNSKENAIAESVLLYLDKLREESEESINKEPLRNIEELCLMILMLNNREEWMEYKECRELALKNDGTKATFEWGDKE